MSRLIKRHQKKTSQLVCLFLLPTIFMSKDLIQKRPIAGGMRWAEEKRQVQQTTKKYYLRMIIT